MSLRTKLKTAFLFSAKICGLFPIAKLLTRKKVRILCYHGGCLGDENRFNPRLFCNSSHLKSRMNWLKGNGFEFVTLDDAVFSLSNNTKRKNYETVITFDDGWHSTASTLIPVLDDLKIPSTLYLCTEHYKEGWPVVAVTVRYLLWKTSKNLVCLTGFSHLLDGEYDLTGIDTKNQLAVLAEHHLAAQCKVAGSIDETLKILEEFAKALGISAEELDLASRRFQYLTENSLQELPAKRCSTELHGHKHSYPTGNPAMFRQDLDTCTGIILEAGLPRPSHYCYPSGNYDQGASNVLRLAGLLSATTCVPGLSSELEGDDQFFMPRFLDGQHISELEFEAEMTGFSDCIRNFLQIPLRLKSTLNPLPI